MTDLPGAGRKIRRSVEIVRIRVRMLLEVVHNAVGDVFAPLQQAEVFLLCLALTLRFYVIENGLVVLGQSLGGNRDQRESNDGNDCRSDDADRQPSKKAIYALPLKNVCIQSLSLDYAPKMTVL